MISTAEPRRNRTLELAVALSLLVHVIGLLIYSGLASRYFEQIRRLSEKPDVVATTDFVQIEKRTIPREAHKLPRPVPKPIVARPRPVAAAQPPAPHVVEHRPRAAPKPVERPELAHQSLRAPAQPSASKQVALQPNLPRASTETAPLQRTPGTGTLTQQQIAALDQQFRNTIEQSKSDLLNNPPPKEAPVATRKYDNVMLGSPRDLEHAQGWVEYHEACPGGRPHCYFLRVFITWPDGYAETVDIPWPYHFTARDDPFLKYGYVVFEAQSPPDGFQLPHPFQLSRLLCIYFRSECQAVLDAEHGDRPAAATN